MTVARASTTVLHFWVPPDFNDPAVSLVATQGRIQAKVAPSEGNMPASSIPNPLAFNLIPATWAAHGLDPLIPGNSVLWRFQARRSGVALSLGAATITLLVTRVEGSTAPQDIVLERSLQADADQDNEDLNVGTGRGWYDVRFSPSDESVVASVVGQRLYYKITAQLNTGDVVTILRGRVEPYQQLPAPVVTNIVQPTSRSGYYECDIYDSAGFSSITFLVQLGSKPNEWITAYTDGEFRGVFKPSSTRTGLGTEAVPYHFKIKPLGFWPKGSNVVRPRAIDTSGNANV